MSKAPHKPSGSRNPLAFGANLYFTLLVLIFSVIIFRVWKLMVIEREHYTKLRNERFYNDSTINVLRGSVISENGAIFSTTIPYYTLSVDMTAGYLNQPRTTFSNEKIKELKEHHIDFDTTQLNSKNNFLSKFLDKLSKLFPGEKKKEAKTIFETELAITAEELAKTFGTRNKEEYSALLKKWHEDAISKGPKPKGYKNRVIEKNIDFATYTKIKKKGIFEAPKGQRSCIVLKENYRAVYPYTNLALRTIGKNPTEEENKNPRLFKNQTGIQYRYNSYLAGVIGKVKRKKVGGKAYLKIDDENNIMPQNGSDVITTLDVNMQDMVDSELRKTLTAHQAEYGTVVVMETATGKIRAMANLGFDSTSRTYSELENYAVRSLFEPGSTFKLASLMAAMEKRGLTPDERVDIEGGTARVGNMTVRDAGHGKAESNLSIQQVFERSSNVGVAKTINRLFGNSRTDVQDFLNAISSFGLLNETRIDLFGEKPPMVFNQKDKRWTPNYSLIKLSFGYFFQFTPLQLLNFYNTVANNGRQMRPYLVSEIRYLDDVVERFAPEVVNPKICSDKTLKWAHQLMVGVALNGTAKGRDSLEFYYAGKTGTVQIWNNPKDKIPNAPADGNGNFNNYLFPDGNGRWTNRHQVSFVGYFPKDKPTYSIIIVVNYPKTPEPTGGGIAAPLFREIAKRIYAGSLNYQFRALKMPSRTAVASLHNGNQTDLKHLLRTLKLPYVLKGEEVLAKTDHNGNRYLLSGIRIPQKSMPDLTGMNLKDALFILEKRGIRPVVKGKGRIVSQSVTAGSSIRAGMPLQLELAL